MLINDKIRKHFPFQHPKNCSKVIIDVDTGCDDAQAIITLIHLAKKYKKQILGITCVFGNGTVQDVVINTLITLKQCNSKIKIYKGNRDNILGNHKLDYYFKQDSFNGHQKQYKSTLTQQDYALIQEQPAYSFISRSIKQYKNDVALIMTAPVTNLALAYLTDNTLPQYIGSLTIMGGSISGIGLNQCFSSEFNFNGDAQAIYIVLKNFFNVILISLDLAFQFNSKENYFIQKSTKRGRLMNNLYNGMPYVVCDPLTLFPAIVPQSIISVYKVYGEIVLQGTRTRGFLAIDWLPKIQRQLNLIMVASVNQQLINKQLMQALLDQVSI